MIFFKNSKRQGLLPTVYCFFIDLENGLESSKRWTNCFYPLKFKEWRNWNSCQVKEWGPKAKVFNKKDHAVFSNGFLSSNSLFSNLKNGQFWTYSASRQIWLKNSLKLTKNSSLDVYKKNFRDFKGIFEGFWTTVNYTYLNLMSFWRFFINYSKLSSICFLFQMPCESSQMAF